MHYTKKTRYVRAKLSGDSESVPRNYPGKDEISLEANTMLTSDIYGFHKVSYLRKTMFKTRSQTTK